MAEGPRFHFPGTVEITREMQLLSEMNGFHRVRRRGHLRRLTDQQTERFQRELAELAGLKQIRISDSEMMRHPNFRRYHPPLYFATSAVVHAFLRNAAITLRLQANRWLNLALGLSTVGLTYLLATLWWPERRDLPMVAAGLVAFQPLFAFNSAVVTNQILTVLLFNLVLLCLFRWVGGAGPPSLVLWIGVLVALGSLCRVDFLAVLLPLCLVLFCRPEVYVKWSVAALTVAVLGLSWYLPLMTGEAHEIVRSYKGDKVASRQVGVSVSRPGVASYLKGFDWKRWPRAFEEFWGGALGFEAGRNDPSTPRPLRRFLSWAFGLATMVGVIASTRGVRRRKAWVLVAALLSLMLFYQVVDYYCTWLVIRPGLAAPRLEGYFWFRGQYFLPVLPALMLLSLKGLSGWRQGRWLWCLPLLMMAANFYTLFGVLVPRYYAGTLTQAFARAHGYSPLSPWVLWLLIFFLELGCLAWLLMVLRLRAEPCNREIPQSVSRLREHEQ